MSKYDQHKKELQSLIEKEAQHLRSTFDDDAIFSAFKYNYYKLKLFLVELLKSSKI